MSADMLAQSIAAATKGREPLLIRVGVIGGAQAAAHLAGWTVTVTGVLERPLTLGAAAFGEPFLNHIGAHGQGVVGKRVLVLFANQQPVIICTLGDA
jgi:hypothetical protein